MYVPVAGDVGEVVEREDHLLTLSEKVSQVAVGSKLHDEAQWATCSTHKAHSSYTHSHREPTSCGTLAQEVENVLVRLHFSHQLQLCQQLLSLHTSGIL